MALLLRSLAAIYEQGKGDPIIAEGLFRSAMDKLGTTEQKPGRMSAHEFDSLMLIAKSYAALLRRLEWNGKSRAAEADALDGQMKQ